VPGELGLFAAVDFLPGDLIFKEDPAMVVSFSARSRAGVLKMGAVAAEKFLALPHNTRTAVLGLAATPGCGFLHEHLRTDKPEELVRSLAEGGFDVGTGDLEDVSRFLGILDTNMYTKNVGEVALYVTFSRANHSCEPNARSNNYGLVACGSIVAGEEIFISYLPEQEQLLPPEKRRTILQRWGFVCGCRSCTDWQDTEAPPQQAEARALDEHIDADPENATVEDFDRLAQLVHQLPVEHWLGGSALEKLWQFHQQAAEIVPSGKEEHLRLALLHTERYLAFLDWNLRDRPSVLRPRIRGRLARAQLQLGDVHAAAHSAFGALEESSSIFAPDHQLCVEAHTTLQECCCAEASSGPAEPPRPPPPTGTAGPCLACAKQVEAVAFCPECRTAQYCSKDCQKKDKKRHNRKQCAEMANAAKR